MVEPVILQTLEKYFGYTSFRPLQEEIITDLLNHKDVFVLMPTGGGKSLCYQLPSIIQSGVTIVVSPLISLMKDQVDTLRQNGISAAFLNSSLSASEQSDILHFLESQQLRLLYVAPERLMQNSFQYLLKKLQINFFAIDEAHCISHWGHDFRPEYRQLSVLRNEFPQIPIMALTATATERVKIDIIKQLSLNQANVYQASFNRPNLTYYIYPKQDPFEITMRIIHEHPNESGIIYCQSRSTVERIAKKLQEHGVKALPYHAGLPDETRKANQESFIKDNVEVITATIAFGMGIDKPNVRFVIHYDLPKSLENYYQETGRAGRDGLPSQCVFLFSIADKYFYDRFLTEKAPEEQVLAKQQLQQVISYAQSKLCRRVQLLRYFHEEYVGKNCAACDNCISPRETFDGTVIAQKILSCIYRVHERFGAKHIISILTGSKSKKILTVNHHLLSTYNIVQDYEESDLSIFIHELIQLGYIAQTDDQYGILSLTPLSKAVLTGKETVLLTKITEQIETKAYLGAHDSSMDKELFDRLRTLRKQLAEKGNVPPYIIFADTSLKEMATYFPQTTVQFARIYGVGKEKLKNYGDIFIQAIVDYSESKNISPKQPWISIK